jgi:2-oxo-4-hydroxy-4-carboxy-5-ureidoimidazoline decarboxylase
MDEKPTIKSLIHKPVDFLLPFLGSVYEHSPWVAEGLVADKELYGRLESISDLGLAMKTIVDQSSYETKLKLLQAHPDLCERVGLNQLSQDSQDEQSRAGLQSLTVDELETFNEMNSRYRNRFGFPFILAVRNASKYTVLSALRGRVNNTPEVEFATAMQQVHKIAWMRLISKIDTADAKGFLTCHVLDTANGCPGKCSRFPIR